MLSLLRLRRVRERLANNDARSVAFPLSGQGRHAKVVTSGAGYPLGELVGVTLCTDTQDDVVAAVAPPLAAEVIGELFFGGLFHSLSQPGFILTGQCDRPQVFPRSTTHSSMSLYRKR